MDVLPPWNHADLGGRVEPQLGGRTTAPPATPAWVATRVPQLGGRTTAPPAALAWVAAPPPPSRVGLGGRAAPSRADLGGSTLSHAEQGAR
jgi:hypothetical protein